MNKPIKVLIVDDSALMRKALSFILQSEPEIEVVGTARNGWDGIEKIGSLSPDIVTMDIEMPVMDGLTALREIMKTRPVPVIMISSLTTEGAEATMEALSAGAMDFIAKELSPSAPQLQNIREELVKKVKALVYRSWRQRAQQRAVLELGATVGEAHRPTAPKNEQPNSVDSELILIGASTGGPQTLQEIIPKLPENLSQTILLVQHMPAQFTRFMAERLNKLSAVNVIEAENGQPLLPNTVYVAPGGHQLSLRRHLGTLMTHITDADQNQVYKPSVTVTANAVAELVPHRAIGVMLTGMGRDGLEGFKKMKAAHNHIIAQAEESAIIYGMPKAVVEAGIADAVLTTEEIAAFLRRIGEATTAAKSHDRHAHFFR